MSSKGIPGDLVAKMMVKCGRRCCVCRRFRPTKLQVHHIVERSQGGSNDEDNLIVTCFSCHSDVHTHVPFARRFTVDELKGHQDAVVKIVAEGRLPRLDADDTDTLLAALAEQHGANPINDIQLIPEACEILVAAVNAEGLIQGEIMALLQTGGFTVNASGKNVVQTEDGWTEARYKRGLKQLSSGGIIEDRGYKGEIFDVTYEGYLVADEIKSRVYPQDDDAADSK